MKLKNNNWIDKRNIFSVIRMLMAFFFVLAIFVQAQYGLFNAGTVFGQSYNLKDILMYIFFSFGIFLTYSSNLKMIKYSALIVTFFTFAIFNAHENIISIGENFKTGLGFELSDANLILMELPRSGSVSEVFVTYSSSILYVILECLLYIFLIHFVVHNLSVKIKNHYITIIPFTAIALVYMIFGSGAAVYKMPIAYKVPFQFYRASSLNVYKGDRAPVKLAHNGERLFENIMFIVDESVRGDALGINSFHLDTTPYLNSIKEGLFNFGNSLAASNCSASSNILLQTGVLPYKDQNLTSLGYRLFEGPNIFQYAKKAGYRTVYIDGQLKGGKLQNYMKSNDFEYINSYIQVRSQFESIEKHEIDQYIVEIITEELSVQSPVFFYVVKSGNHFPYEYSYPDSEKIFYPTSTIKTLENKLEIRNSYYNSTRWNVDHFFEKLIPNTSDQDKVIFYTSDHGQNLMDDGRLTGQCSNDIGHLSEVNVPLFMFATGENKSEFATMTQKNLKTNQEKTSHFNIFSSLLILQGYDSEKAKLLYGKSLFDELNGKRYYISSLVPGSKKTKLYSTSQ